MRTRLVLAGLLLGSLAIFGIPKPATAGGGFIGLSVGIPVPLPVVPVVPAPVYVPALVPYGFYAPPPPYYGHHHHHHHRHHDGCRVYGPPYGRAWGYRGRHW